MGKIKIGEIDFWNVYNLMRKRDFIDNLDKNIEEEDKIYDVFFVLSKIASREVPEGFYKEGRITEALKKYLKDKRRIGKRYRIVEEYGTFIGRMLIEILQNFRGEDRIKAAKALDWLLDKKDDFLTFQEIVAVISGRKRYGLPRDFIKALYKGEWEKVKEYILTNKKYKEAALRYIIAKVYLGEFLSEDIEKLEDIGILREDDLWKISKHIVSYQEIIKNNGIEEISPEDLII